MVVLRMFYLGLEEFSEVVAVIHVIDGKWVQRCPAFSLPSDYLA